MPVTLPGDEYAHKLIRLYSKAERDIEKQITKALMRSKGKKTFTIQTLEKQKKEVEAILDALLKATPDTVHQLAEAAFTGGTEVARKELKGIGAEIVATGKGINAKAVNIYAEQTYSRLADVVTTAKRTTGDIYDALKLETALSGSLSGYESLTAVQRAMNRVAEGEGIVGFVDSAGRQWNIARYVEMLTRTVTTDIYNKAKIAELEKHGEDLVVFSAHGSKCPLCAPWEGKIVSLSGKDKRFPSLAEAKEKGMLHPNCRHLFNLWIEGTPIPDSGTTVDKPKPVEKNKKTPKAKPKPKGARRDYQCDLAQKVGKDHYDSIRDCVDNCESEDLKKLWLKREKEIVVGKKDISGGAYCSSDRIYVNIERDKAGNSYNKPYGVVFHESGHALDYITSPHGFRPPERFASTNYKNGLFIDTIKDEVMEKVNTIYAEMKLHKDDFDYWVAQGWITERQADFFKQSYRFKVSKSHAYSAVEKSIKDKYTLMEYSDISDMLEGATRGKIQCGVGHGTSYWSKLSYQGIDYGLGTEAFAEMTSATMTSPESLKTIKEVLPKSYAVYLDMVKDMLKNS